MTLRVMYWPNEPAHLYPDFTQAGGRAAFEAMAADGTVSALSIYSYRVERARFASPAEFEASALQAVAAFAPDILFVQHVWGSDLSASLWPRLKAENPAITLVFHEGDPFDRRVKRIDRATIGILSHADLVLACGLGSLAEILADHARAPIGWLPHAFVKGRFATRDPASAAKNHDVAMIGNCGRRRRLKWAYVPGGRRRAELAERLTRALGDRFALYGAGWSHLSSARGTLPFFEQEAAIQSARVTANWDHFDEIAFYFSDRLPISLAAGVPHVTTYHAGYEHLFAGVPGLYPCRTVEEAVETCRWLLSRPDEELLAEGLAAKEWVFAHMEAEGTFRRGLAQGIAMHRQRLAARA